MSEQNMPDTDKKTKNRRFKADNRYFSICIYAVLTFTVCLIIYKLINNWREARDYAAAAINTLSPFLIAFLIVYFINPLVNNIDKLLFGKLKIRHFPKIHKFISLVLAYFVFIGAIVLIMIFLVPQIVDSIVQLVRQMSTTYDTVIGWMQSLEARYPEIDFEYIETIITDALPNAIDSLQSMMTDLIPMIYNAGRSIVSWVINIILAFIISCYLMSGRRSLINGLKKGIYVIFDETTAYKVILMVKKCNSLFSSFIIGKFIDSVIMGILCFICMSVLNLQMAVLISLLVGVTNMIPYFGPFIGAIPSALILLIISPRQALVFLIMILILQQIDGNIIGPRILGDSVGIRPLWVIFAITVGGAAGGLLGMFLSVPIMAIIVYLVHMISDYMLYRKNIKPDLSNITVPDINEDNIFIPKDAVINNDSEDPENTKD